MSKELNITKSFAEFVKSRREDLGYNQSQLAEMVFGSKSRQDQISKIENKQKSVSTQTMGRILSSLKADFKFIESGK